jgi:hypothetical protein
VGTEDFEDDIDIDADLGDDVGDALEDDGVVDAAVPVADDATDSDEDDADEDDDVVGDDDEEDEEEEASLDVLLRGETEDDTVRGTDPRDELAKTPVTVGEGEFTCRSCFLVKRRAQLADADRLICLDCD